MKGLVSVLLTVFAVALLATPQALALTAPAQAYLTGATTSGGTGNYAFDAAPKNPPVACSGTKTTLCDGDDATTLGTAIIMSTSFTVASFVAGDSFEFDLTMGSWTFVFVLYATGASAATLYTYWKSSGAASWSAGDSVSCSSCDGTGGTVYSTANVGFRLDNAGNGNSHSGDIIFYVAKAYLITSGGTGSSVSTVFAQDYAGGTTCPAALTQSGFCPTSGTPGGGVTAEARSPTSGTLSYTLANPLPELPFGLIFLAVPVAFAYTMIRKKKTSQN
jgi:hypothetical protein